MKVLKVLESGAVHSARRRSGRLKIFLLTICSIAARTRRVLKQVAMTRCLSLSSAIMWLFLGNKEKPLLSVVEIGKRKKEKKWEAEEEHRGPFRVTPRDVTNHQGWNDDVQKVPICRGKWSERNGKKNIEKNVGDLEGVWMGDIPEDQTRGKNI